MPALERPRIAREARILCAAYAAVVALRLHALLREHIEVGAAGYLAVHAALIRGYLVRADVRRQTG